MVRFSYDGISGAKKLSRPTPRYFLMYHRLNPLKDFEEIAVLLPYQIFFSPLSNVWEGFCLGHCVAAATLLGVNLCNLKLEEEKFGFIHPFFTPQPFMAVWVLFSS